MRRSELLLLAMLAIPAAVSAQGPPSAAPPASVLAEGASPVIAESPAGASLLLRGEFLLVRPRREGTEFAVSSHDRDGSTFSTVESLPWDATPAFRVGAAYRLPGSGVELAATFTYLHAKDQQTVSAPDGYVVGVLAANPASRNAAAASGEAGLTYSVLDLDVGRSTRIDQALALRAFGGVRLASIDQSLKATYSGGSLGTSPAIVDTPIRFLGAGLTAGGEADWSIWQGWGVYGRGRLGLLSGEFDGKRTERVGSSGYANWSDRFGAVIPVAEIGAGLNYQNDWGFISAGYEIANWFNMASNVGGRGGASNPSGRRRGALTLEALAVRLGLMF